MVEYHESMICEEEEKILKLTEELNPLKSRLKQIKLPNEELGRAKKEVLRLSTLKQSLLDSISEDKEFIQNLEMIVGLPDEPQHPCLPDNTVGEPEITLTILACALCKHQFPKLDVLVAPCRCAYHPWCAVCQNWRSGSCATKQCKSEFPIAWKESTGLNKLKGQIQYPQFHYCFRNAQNTKELYEILN